MNASFVRHYATFFFWLLSYCNCMYCTVLLTNGSCLLLYQTKSGVFSMKDIMTNITTNTVRLILYILIYIKTTLLLCCCVHYKINLTLTY